MSANTKPTISQPGGHLAEPEGDFQVLHEFVEAARANLTGNIWDYLVGATETETTMRRNRLALDSLAFRPRVLRDVSKVDVSHSFLGKKMRLPVMFAPVGSLESFHPEGGAEAARAATTFGVPIVVSSVTKPGLEDVARASGDGRRIFQLYVRGGDEFVDDHVARAVDSGYEAFCITVDTQAYSRRERDISRRFVKPWRAAATGHADQAGFNWDKIRRFKDKHSVPLILKGIATAEDAAIACEHGVDVVWVSNHGGRQLDHGRGAMDVLPEVLDAIQGRARTIVDGSFSRGTDVLKAIALGADSVAIGRLYCYGLAAGGAKALVQLMELLEHEMGVDLALIGCTALSQLNRAHLHAAPPVFNPHVHSAFPLMDVYTPHRK
ncbi:MAG: alpha-hydroxy-acid oxidizing protein [Acetobacteraceae bacterium]|nr:alpha-hydroxy-acid oxidizing protein [Acetobacteraceae bacterium]